VKDISKQLCFLIADHYAAKLAGLVPADPLAAALADEAYFFVEDILQVCYLLLLSQFL
jgi:hypothetical protein